MQIKRLLKKITIFQFSLLILCGCSSGSNDYTFNLTFDYGNLTQRVDPDTGESIPLITPLLDSGFLEFDFTADTMKYDFMVPGDTLTIEYTGDLYAQETYPAKWFIENGEVSDAVYSWATIIEIPNECIVRNNSKIDYISGYNYSDDFVVLDKELNYIALDEYEGDTLFGSHDVSRELSCPDGCFCNVQLFALGALFAFNPRI